jgi:alpha-tubulin suppressor-like RCC1 family protein
MVIESLAHKRIVQASAGGFHTLALSDDNDLYAWGSGTYGECGLGEF